MSPEPFESVKETPDNGHLNGTKRRLISSGSESDGSERRTPKVTQTCIV